MGNLDSAIWQPRVLSVLRIMTGLLFLEHGTQHLFGFPAPPSPAAALSTLLYVQGILELFGGALIVIGLFTRPVAFILSGDMAVAYFMSHWAIMSDKPGSFFPILNRGDAAILYCFVFLYLCVAGAGAWSADRARQGD